MQKSVTISIIAPIYGVERYIAEFAESLLSQDYPNIEFIFVNDGTKDRSMEILAEVIDSKYSHLREQITIVNKENGGLPAARKTGLEHATGDYVYHVDSDDWLSEGAITKIAQEIKRTGSDIIYFNLVKEYGDRSKPKRERRYDSTMREEYIRNMYNHRSFAAVWNKCVCRTIYTEHTIYTPKYGYAEDCYLTSQLVGYARTVSFLDEYIYHYRKGNPAAMTSQQRRKRKREYALNFLDLYDKYHHVAHEENPVAPILDDIIIQAGWYSLFYRLNLFKEYDWLAKEVRKAKMRRGTNVWLGAQIITKLYALFR